MSAEGIPAVLTLGDPRLRVVAAPVEDPSDPALRADIETMSRALADFRETRGFGRAISAPQLGIPKRIIVLDLGEGPVALVNPEITWASDEVFTMWDDCMSFPSILVRVQRHESISVAYATEDGQQCEWSELGRAEAELLQHEIDHLDGILAIDRAQGEGSLVMRTVFDAAPDRFVAEVDYTIAPRTPSNRPPPATA
jgi:peptide deformylase